MKAYFPTDMAAIQARIAEVDPIRYASSRNFKEGAVTRLSPYISRGVISTKQVYQHICRLGLSWASIEKLVQELAWRDYWQQVWIASGDKLNQDLRYTQEQVKHHEIPVAILEANTGIQAVDEALKELAETGYMHNHMRMYVAAICCNIAKSHWLAPARWMYSQLLDGDLASNHLSWQWVAGSFSNKKYHANQANINKYFNSSQRGTFLDIEYDEFAGLAIPEEVKKTRSFELKTLLPELEGPALDPKKDTAIYTYYNLDPNWHIEENIQRVLLLEPSFFEVNPVSQHCLDFVLKLAQNITGIQVYVGEFNALANQLQDAKLFYKEHPTNRHFKGIEEPRDWLSSVTGEYPSFFAFWKRVKKEIEPLNERQLDLPLN